MIALQYIDKTREYLDYLERHILNVQKAWKEIQEKCKDMPFIWDDYKFAALDNSILYHDLSKFSEKEFTQYRRHFKPTQHEGKNCTFGQENKNKFIKQFNKAWEYHKKHNDHHWEKWTKTEYYEPWSQELYCVEMVIDWMAMGYEFGNSAKEYYEKNKKEIDLPEWAVKFVYEIFERLEK